MIEGIIIGTSAGVACAITVFIISTVAETLGKK